MTPNRPYDGRAFASSPLVREAFHAPQFIGTYENECPHCGAPPFEPCRDPRGYITYAHKRRGAARASLPVVAADLAHEEATS